jgi:hypothetical protein
MRLKPILIAIALTLPIPTAAALAHGTREPGLLEATVASAPFHQVHRAEAAGYGLFRDAQGIACIDKPGVGAMGIHYVNGALVGDTVLDPMRPEALVYRPNGGNLRLAALEYIVFQGAWDETHSLPPSLFGRQFDFTPSPNRYGIPAFYSLHAWVWNPNPAGLLEPWNPNVKCPVA